MFTTSNQCSRMDTQINFLFIVKLLLFILVFVHVPNICWTHRLKQLWSNLFLHTLIDFDICFDLLSLFIKKSYVFYQHKHHQWPMSLAVWKAHALNVEQCFIVRVWIHLHLIVSKIIMWRQPFFDDLMRMFFDNAIHIIGYYFGIGT